MNKRQGSILDLVERNQRISVSEIVAQFKVSEATIRRDLALLEEQGKLIRTFGGARNINDLPITAKSFSDRKQKNTSEKKRIADEAVKLIEPGMVIALDNGTTTWMIATYLKQKSPLTIITSSLAILQTLHNIPDITLLFIGGKFRLRNLDFIGDATAEGYKRWNADISFISGDSIRLRRGIFKIEEESATIANTMILIADKIVGVLDYTKIENPNAPYLGVKADDLDLLITNRCEKTKQKNLPYKIIET